MACAYYLESTLSPEGQETAARRIIAEYSKSGIKAKAVAFTGLSGALVAPLVAARLKLPMVAVRKGETSHSSFMVETAMNHIYPIKYIVVDDLVSSGSTLRRVVEEVEKRNSGSQCLGVFCYLEKNRSNLPNGSPGVLQIPHYQCQKKSDE